LPEASGKAKLYLSKIHVFKLFNVEFILRVMVRVENPVSSGFWTLPHSLLVNNSVILYKPSTTHSHMTDIQITITDREGAQHQVLAPTDLQMNLMEICKSYELPVMGTCGGMALCASCHVYVESDHALPDQSDDEIEMLDQAFFVQENSRLGCQIKMKPELDGLCVTLAPE
jgi:ferredoxin